MMYLLKSHLEKIPDLSNEKSFQYTLAIQQIFSNSCGLLIEGALSMDGQRELGVGSCPPLPPPPQTTPLQRLYDILF